MEKIPNLVDKNNFKLKDIEAQKRGELLSDIKEKRLQRDDLLKESSSLKTKIKDIFGANEREGLKNQIQYAQGDLYRHAGYRKENVYEELDKKSREIIMETIGEPLSKLKSIFYELKDFSNPSEKDNLLLKDAKDIMDNFKFQNITEGFNHLELAEKINYHIDNFLVQEDKALYIRDIEEKTNFLRKLSKVFLSAVSSNVENGEIYKYKCVDKMVFLRTLEKAQDINSAESDDNIDNNLSILMNNIATKIDIFYLSQAPNLIELAASNSVEFRETLINKIDSIFVSESWHDINSACKSSSQYLSEIALERLDNYLKRYGISVDDVKFAWELFPLKRESHGYKYNNIEVNIIAMNELESNRPGIVKSLFSEFGIKEFHRYPLDVLVKQFDTKDQDLPYGIILFTNDDHNDAFDADKKIIESIFEQTDDKLLLRVAEFQSRFSFLKKLASFNDRYGQENKIEYLLWGSHGWQAAIGDIGMSQLNGAGAKRTKDFFIDKPEIILASCSTGAEGAVGQKMSEIYDATVHAPSQPSNLKDVSASFDSQNKIHFKVEFDRNCGNTYSSGNKLDSED